MTQAVIRHWLLNSGVQVPAGAERGGVAGWLNERGDPEFVYTEVTGYYLTAMAFMLAAGSREDGTAACRASLTFEWLLRRCERGEVPPTRSYLSGQNDDWRSSAVFAFDLAMALRGVAAIRGLVPEDQRRSVQDLLTKSLLSFCTPGSALIPFLPNQPDVGNRIPVRWSTTPGPYQTKIAASILLALDSATPPALENAVRNIRRLWCADVRGRCLTGHWHSDLYFIEGLILLGLYGQDSQAWRLAGENYRAAVDCLGSTLNMPDGLPLPESAMRSDVIAQLLRAGCILRSNGCLTEPAWAEKLDGLALLLHSFISTDGAVSFRPISLPERLHWNAWCALFAHQALCFHDLTSRGNKLEARLIRLLI